ncbi:uncharacterized protein [Eurosta solidaginis]|uniref:uncharacterized protein n=1 Tax=Eurosta solidaginis TaxID=178769 RepID=UPI0035305E35
MKSLSKALLFTSLLVVASAQSGYRYQQPQSGPALPPANHLHQHHHHHQLGSPQAAVPQPNLPLFSPVQSPPLPSFNPPQGHAAPPSLPPIQELPLAPPPVPQDNYLAPPPPQQQQQQFGQQQSNFGSAPQNFHSQAQFGGANLGLPSGSGGFQQNVQSFQSRPQTAIITKDIYIHSAPEDQEETLLGNQLESGPIRKNYRIVFIKAPSHNIKLAPSALRSAQNSNEDKTVIYVLSKKPDLTEVQQQLQQAQSQQKSHKPEVYFIKYKTQEEAQRAQQEIQAQYDALGGSTHISDEGVAPITSVSSGGAFNLSGSIGQQHSQQSFQSLGGSHKAPSNQYLPIKKK